MNPTRRGLVLSAALTPLAAACSHLPAGPETLDAPLAELYARCLEESPHNATSYGLDSGAHAALRTRWPERSRAEAERLGRGYAARLAALKTAAAASTDPERRATADAALFALERAVEGAAFTYGDQTLMPTIDQEGTPYPINQMIGLAMSGPQLLAAQQPLANPTDREAFVARLSALGPAIDAETRWFRYDGAAGVRPPRFILQTMQAQLEASLAVPAAQSRVVRAWAAAAQGDNDAVTKLIEREVMPAVARQRDAVLEALPQAGDAAGVKHLPDGERYYAWALKVATSTALTARDVHALGVRTSREIASRMEPLLAARGLTEGSLAQRLQALAADARQRFANDERGRAEALDHCNAWVRRVRAAMPRWSRLALAAPLRVERVPAEREAGAAGAYMAPGAFDGSRPPVFHLNLRDTAAWPRWALPTLVVHETLPGHVWQEAYETEVARRHPVRTLLRFNGYSEGWALYAERLVDEAGFYDDDPLARLGYLQAQQLRATRLVVDTGLHALGWSRERAVRVLAQATGRPLAAVQGEIDRYCVKPGQACGYMVGQLELVRLRERWTTQGRGDAVAFNDAVLRAGNLPLTVLGRELG